MMKRRYSVPIVFVLLLALVQLAIFCAHLDAVVHHYLGTEQGVVGQATPTAFVIPAELRFEALRHALCIVAYIFVLTTTAGLAVCLLLCFLDRACHLALSRPQTTSHPSITIMTILSIIETLFCCVMTVEAIMLDDMGVHFLDVNLWKAIGLRRVIERQMDLQRDGGFLDPRNMSAVLLVIALAVVAQLCAVWIASSLDQYLRNAPLHLPWWRTRKVLIAAYATVAGVLMAAYVLTPYLVTMRFQMFRGQLPFAGWGSANIPITPRVAEFSTTAELLDIAATGRGYPVLALGASSTAYPRITNKRNIIILVQEQGRAEYYDPSVAPGTRAWLAQNDCVEPEQYLVAGHTTITAVFGMLSGVMSTNLFSFQQHRVPFLPLEILRANGYELGIFFATNLWFYPNNHIVEHFQTAILGSYNDRILPGIAAFAETRQRDDKPFLIYAHMDYPTEAEYEKSTDKRGPAMRRIMDADRMKVLRYFEERGLMQDTLVVITSDHGNMDCHSQRDGAVKCEHGENGHAQPESSWWNEKLVIPARFCLAGRNRTQPRPTRVIPGMAAQTDLLPTIMDFVKLDPPLPARAFSHGRALPLGFAEQSDNRNDVAATVNADVKEERVNEPVPARTEAASTTPPSMVQQQKQPQQQQQVQQRRIRERVLATRQGARMNIKANNNRDAVSTRDAGHYSYVDDDDDGAPKLLYATPRFYPETDKIVAALTTTRKVWFRTPGSSSMLSATTEKYTDWKDNELCPELRLRAVHRDLVSRLRPLGDNMHAVLHALNGTLVKLSEEGKSAAEVARLRDPVGITEEEHCHDGAALTVAVAARYLTREWFWRFSNPA